MKRMWSKNEIANQKKNIATLVDSQGHERFIEGDISLGASVPSGVNKIYGKWSLSGTHLMIVLALKIPLSTTIDNNLILGHLDLPDYILDKIYPITDATSPLVVRFNDVSAYTQNFGSSYSFKTRIDKVSNGIDIKKTGESYSQTANTFLSIAFDLLIDSE